MENKSAASIPCKLCNVDRTSSKTALQPSVTPDTSPNYETIKKYKPQSNNNSRPYKYEDQNVARLANCYSQESCGCSKSVAPKMTTMNTYKVMCACFDKRPRSSTVSGRVSTSHVSAEESHLLISANATNRISDFSKMYRRSDYVKSYGRTCKTNECCTYKECSYGWTNDSKSYRCSCFVNHRFYNYKNICQCVQCTKTIVRSRASVSIDVDEYDGKVPMVRPSDAGISLVQNNHHNISHYARDVYAKELRYTEPRYENVIKKVADPSPKYANVDAIMQKCGDRLGPEGENSEDEVQYENVPSNKKQRRMFSASVNNLYLVSSSSVETKKCCGVTDSLVSYSDNRSGTFPQYLQKEVQQKGLNGLHGGGNKGQFNVKDMRPPSTGVDLVRVIYHS